MKSVAEEAGSAMREGQPSVVRRRYKTAVHAAAWRQPEAAMWTAKLVVVAALMTAAAAQFAGMDIAGLLNDQARLTEIIQCLLANSDSGCSLQGRLLKGVLPRLLESNCAQCSEGQKQEVAGVLRHLVNDRPQDWQRLADKYDSAGSLRVQHGDEWRARGVNL